MTRSVLELACLVVGGALFTGAAQEPRSIGTMDPSGAFFAPDFAADPDVVLATTKDGALRAGPYLRYLAARLGTHELEELAFDWILARECDARGLARTAPALARPLGARRLHDSGRDPADDPGADAQRKFANEALRRLRIDALVRARRLADERALHELFDHRYGVGGERVRVRQVLVSFAMTRRRLTSGGATADEDAVKDAARARAQELHARLQAGAKLQDLLGESDDRSTRSLLRDRARAGEAGIVPAYNYRRYGDAFAAAVRALAPGEVSAPVASDQGYHVIELIERTVTRYQDVLEALQRELASDPTSPGEAESLRRELLASYRYEVAR